MEDQEATINAQKEQISRYQQRLKDVVTAYKGLLKEKEALEASLTSFNGNKVENGVNEKANENTDDGESLKLQVNTLMNSLATLSAEKSRMEQMFQSDKKQLRQDIAEKDKTIKDLQEQVKQLSANIKHEKDNYKSRLIIERHDREKEHNDLMLMVRELQKHLSDERHLKENLEMQLNDLKTQFSQTSNSDRAIKDLSQELESTKKKLKQFEQIKANDQENDSVIQNVVGQMETLKQQHMVNLKIEQKRAFEANQRNKKLTAIHEERVQSLEARLSELSASVAYYHNLRQLDQENIQQLKDKLNKIQREPNSDMKSLSLSAKKFSDIQSIITEIEELKLLLMYENSKLDEPIDISQIFNCSDPENPDENQRQHMISMDMYMKVKKDLQECTAEKEYLKNELLAQCEHIRTLQEKVKVLNHNIDEYEHESKTRNSHQNSELKIERTKWRETIATMEIEYRSKISQLEQQLQKQRERSLTLLEEKENEIKSLKQSVEHFIPQKESDLADEEQSISMKRKNDHLAAVLNSSLSGNMTPETHMIYYSNELARKEMELGAARKAKRDVDTMIRQTLKEKVMIEEDSHERIKELEQQVDRLERTKSREGANLEYLKNVFFSFLTSSDAESKKKMLNAISAVLKFNSSEVNAINNYKKK